MNSMKRLLFLFGTISLLVVPGAGAAVPGEKVSGTIKIDGSSTVYPITEAIAEEFGKIHSGVKVTVGISGTGGGFKKFTIGEIDISDASRPIKQAEHESAQKSNIGYIELPVAYDALSIVVNKKNTWLDKITVAELKKIWEPEAQGKVTTWNQVNPKWPNKPIKLFGPGTDSGTFDYFTEAIMGKEDASRGDYTSSEDDNVLVQGVASDEYALGYFGTAYYQENQDKLRAVPLDDEKDDNGKGAILPTSENVIAGSYQPLSRPLFIYVGKAAADRPEVKAFVDFYLAQAPTITKEVGYIALPDKVYSLATQRFETRKVGTMFTKGHQVGVTLEALLAGTQG